MYAQTCVRISDLYMYAFMFTHVLLFCVEVSTCRFLYVCDRVWNAVVEALNVGNGHVSPSPYTRFLQSKPKSLSP